ncbi:hypothetical protein LWI29_037782 [Acer saccharum]|uniref:Uncharacterized protein n=1 Tax=Acer saccharum TaxID=4024 RepID=A0AA39SR65_ACESA|nr:hypothetical protein LWI29_037782 [Acer saccharum]
MGGLLHWNGSAGMVAVGGAATVESCCGEGDGAAAAAQDSRAWFGLQHFLMPKTRSGHSYNFMDQGSTNPNPPNPPNPNTNTNQTSTSFQQQIDQLSQTLGAIMHRLDVIDERSTAAVTGDEYLGEINELLEGEMGLAIAKEKKRKCSWAGLDAEHTVLSKCHHGM